MIRFKNSEQGKGEYGRDKKINTTSVPQPCGRESLHHPSFSSSANSFAQHGCSTGSQAEAIVTKLRWQKSSV